VKNVNDHKYSSHTRQDSFSTVKAEGATNPQTIECTYPAVLSSLTYIASNESAYSNLVIINCKLTYYVEIMRSLGVAVCSQKPDLWPIFGSAILTVFEVTERSVSRSLWRKAEQQTLAELHITLFGRQCHCSTAIYRCTAHHIIQQTVPL